jgi:hypothetical protein
MQHYIDVLASQGTCEEVPHGLKRKSELFTISKILVKMQEKMSEKLNLWKDEGNDKIK